MFIVGTVTLVLGRQLGSLVHWHCVKFSTLFVKLMEVANGVLHLVTDVFRRTKNEGPPVDPEIDRTEHEYDLETQITDQLYFC